MGFAALAVVWASPVAAQASTTAASCLDAGGNLQVEFLQLSSGNGVLGVQLDGTYSGDIGVRVFCSTDGADIAGSAISFLTSVKNTTVNGQQAYCPNTYTGSSKSIYIPDPACTPVSIALPTGRGTIQLTSTNPGLSATDWFAQVGMDNVTITKANNQAVAGLPNMTAGIWARTPELDSIFLFGTGALGIAGYAVTRLRAARRH